MKNKISLLPGSRIITIALSVLLLISSIVSGQTLEDINWYTEEYPPYNYLENDTPKGLSIDILVAMWKKAGLSRNVKDIKVVPWSRGLEKIKTIPGTCLFTTTITAERKAVFGWKFVYPAPQISEASSNHLVARKSSEIKFNSIDDIKKYKKNFGVVKDDIGAVFLTDAGIDESKLNNTLSAAFLVQTLHKGRHDIVSYDFAAIVFQMKAAGINPADYEVVYTFPKKPVGFAFHHTTSPEIIKKLQKALDDLYLNGTIETILKRYTQKQ